MKKVNQDIIKKIEQEQLKTDVPAFGPGDTVVVKVRVKEGEKERLQAYEGVVIAKRNRGLHSAFTVRKISSGEGVERVFQTHSPAIASIELKRLKADIVARYKELQEAKEAINNAKQSDERNEELEEIETELKNVLDMYKDITGKSVIE